MSEPFIGQITLFANSYPPNGWADCLGQLLPIRQYTALFSLLGTTFGGNGTTTFALPNLQAQVAVGSGSAPGLSPYVAGETAGVSAVSVTSAEMAIHSHGLGATQNAGTTNDPGGQIPGMGFTAGAEIGDPSAQGNIYSAAAPNTTLMPTSVGMTGGSQPHNNMQPSLALRYCIALTGVFPSRP
jgi:microcystin-dependent protein